VAQGQKAALQYDRSCLLYPGFSFPSHEDLARMEGSSGNKDIKRNDVSMLMPRHYCLQGSTFEREKWTVCAMLLHRNADKPFIVLFQILAARLANLLYQTSKVGKRRIFDDRS